MDREYSGQFPSANCECHFQTPYGFVPEMDCKEHDTQQFRDFMREVKKQEHDKCTVGCPRYTSGHSISVDGGCNMGCC